MQLHPVAKKAAKGEVVKHNGSFVVMHGESGHKHTITCERMEIRQDARGFYLHLEKEGQLSHEEHKTITVPKGTYFVGKEREMDHFAKAVKIVVD